MFTQNRFERRVQQMCRRVMFGNLKTALIHFCLDYISCMKCFKRFHFREIEIEKLFRIQYLGNAFQYTDITALSAAFGIKRCFVQKYPPLFAAFQFLSALKRFIQQCNYFRFRLSLAVPYKTVLSKLLQKRFKIPLHGSITASLPGCFGTFSLCFHEVLKTFNIDVDPLFTQHILCQIKRKTVRIVEFESNLSAKYLFGTGKLFFKKLQSRCNRFEKTLFLQTNLLFHTLRLLDDIGILSPHNLSQRICQPVHERLFDSQQITVSDRTSQDTSQDISSALFVEIHSL